MLLYLEILGCKLVFGLGRVEFVVEEDQVAKLGGEVREVVEGLFLGLLFRDMSGNPF